MTSPRGGRRPGAGKKKGSKNKLTATEVLAQIEKTCGKPFEELLAEGYALTILAADMPARQTYEKMILGKVIAEKHEIDHTTLGQAMTNVFSFPNKELPDWEEKRELPVKITTLEKQ